MTVSNRIAPLKASYSQYRVGTRYQAKKRKFNLKYVNQFPSPPFHVLYETFKHNFCNIPIFLTTQ